MRRKTRLALLLLVLAAVGLVGASAKVKGGFHHNFGDIYASITRQVFYHVGRKYVEPERVEPRKMIEGAFRSLETRYPQVVATVTGDEARVSVDEAVKTFALGAADDLDGAASSLNEVLDFVSQNLGDQVDKKDVYYFALNGALETLDPHSSVFSPKHFEEFMIGTRGSFGGIGFVFGIRDGEMTIITPIEGTPADRAGLKSGDRILYIDGEPTINMAVDVAAGKMRGDPGTQVTLTLIREEWAEPKAVTFTREVIHVDSVESFVLDGADEPTVIYAKVKNFQKDTTDELRKAVRKAEEENPDAAGVILDLRNNPGGLLEQAIELSDGFLDAGAIVSTRGPEQDENVVARAEADDEPISSKPLVVLVNQGSASASEIVSGALKATRALVIGQKTFGKGSVQKLYPLTDRGALKLTVAQYLTPGDVSIQSIGIAPDIALYPARVEEGKVRLGPPPSHVDEASLDNAFREWGNASDQSWAEVQYLAPEPDEDEPSFAELDRGAKVARLAGEFEVRLARRLLARAEVKEGVGPREALVRAAGPVLREVRQEEAEKLARSLAGVGVDWSRGAGGEGADLVVTFPDEAQLRAGETVGVAATVENLGTEPAYRVWGRSDSANPLLKNVDFVFGKVAPGEKVTWTARVEVPKSALDRWDTLTLELHSGAREEAGSGTGGARTLGIPRPDFAYSVSAADENADDPSLSADGILQDGERMRLVLRVRNRGGAAGEGVEVNIRSDEKEELYLENARYKLEILEPGAEAEAPMSFRLVEPDEEGKVVVGVSVADRDFGAFFSDELTWAVGEPYPARRARVPPRFAVESLPPLRTEAGRVTLEFRAVDDDGEVKDFYAYVGDKKIRYERNRTGSADLPVRLEVPLEEGSNRLTVAARDQDELLHTRTFFIYRAGSGDPDIQLGMK